jgi:APA family basic amino acid/polyamine antiporter
VAARVLLDHDGGDGVLETCTRGMSMPADRRLCRRLGLGDAVVMGLGSMIGAGVFAPVGPIARAAGTGLIAGLAIAAAVGFCNATSSAALAAACPASCGSNVHSGSTALGGDVP